MSWKYDNFKPGYYVSLFHMPALNDTDLTVYYFTGSKKE